MKFVADLHLHSKYSRAVSQAMLLPKMAEWAKYKGINVIATGDFTHPFWFDQLKNELVEAGNGLYQLKLTPGVSQVETKNTPGVSSVYFMLSCEIASIYSQGGKVRRIHTLFMFPSLESVEKFNNEMRKRNVNLRSDGRPIVGITSRDLAQIALEVDQKALVIPAHVWTPWFSLYGSFSGFDSVEECFGDMAKYIYGIETGLSSDPVMNWQVGDLDSRAILSFSDAHSLEKMGREATVFEAADISYGSIYDAVKNVSKVTKELIESETLRVERPEEPKVAFTIEFYPEEGKYHFTGHRNCKISLSPEETKQNGSICTVCKRPLTVGVMHRVEELKTQTPDSPASLKLRGASKSQITNGIKWISNQSGRPPYVRLVPLLEILSASLEAGVNTKKVTDLYFLMVNMLGSDFSILLKASSEEIAKYAPAKVVEGISKVRSGDIYVAPGYDGEFGIVKIWNEEEKLESEDHQSEDKEQLNLFV